MQQHTARREASACGSVCGSACGTRLPLRLRRGIAGSPHCRTLRHLSTASTTACACAATGRPRPCFAPSRERRAVGAVVQRLAVRRGDGAEPRLRDRSPGVDVRRTHDRRIVRGIREDLIEL